MTLAVSPGMRLRTSLASATCLAFLVASSRDAAACSDTGLGDKDHAYAAPGNGTTVPANVGSLFFHPASNCPLGNVDQVTLVDAAGSAVPFTTTPLAGTEALIVPTTPLTAGATYKLRYLDAFGDIGCLATPVAVENVFTVGAAASAPTAVGTATYSTATDGDAGSWSSCGPPPHREVTATLAFTPSDSLRPYAAVVRYETLVDGVAWRSTRFGSLIDTDVPGSSFQGRFDRLVSWCELGGALAPGAHAVEIRATIEGGRVPSPPPLKLTVELSCGSAPGDAAPGDGSPGDAAADAGSSGAPEAAAASDTGCSLAYGAIGATGTGAVGVFVAALAFVRRRTRRTR